MSSASTTMASSRSTNSATNASFFQSTSSSNSSTNPGIPVGSLSLMVARLDNRHPTVILQRPGTNLSNNRANVVVSSSNFVAPASTIRATSVIGQPSNSPSGPVSVSSSSASISVRTTQLIASGQHQPTTGLMNLSGVNHSTGSSTNATHVQKAQTICTQRSFASALPIESVSLVVANTNPNEPNSLVNARSLRFAPNDAKSSASNPHGITNKNSTIRPNVIGSTIVTSQQPKIINLGSSSTLTQPNTTVSQHVTRVGFIGQINTTGSAITGQNKQGSIINLTTTTLPKGLLLNPSLNPPSNNAIHNVVTLSGQPLGQSKLISSTNVITNTTTTTSISNAQPTTRQVVVTSGTPFGQHTNILSNRQNIPQTTTIITTTTTSTSSSLQPPTSQQQSVLQSPTTNTTSSSSPLRPTILSPANSPIKQSQLQSTTPSSPRPSILIRKRIANDNNTQQLTATNLFKTTTNAQSPLRSTIITLNSNSNNNNNNDSLSSINSQHEPIRIDATNSNEISQSQNSDISSTRSLSQLSNTNNTTDGIQTPRKKPRKQLLEPFNLKSSHNIQLLNSNDVKIKDKDRNDLPLSTTYCNDKDSSSTSTSSSINQVNNSTNNNNNNKRPRASLLSTYSMPWKALQYHFLRYSDVKPKPEKKLTLSELSNEGLQRKNGWKIHHLATQMEVMSDNELSVNQRLTHFLETFERDANLYINNNNFNNSVCNSPLSNTFGSTSSVSSSTLYGSGATSDNNNNSNSNNLKGLTINSSSDYDVHCIATKLSDLIRGNLQRSHLFSDQINEARQLVIKLTNDHKERVGKITKKCANKRTYITKS